MASFVGENHFQGEFFLNFWQMFETVEDMEERKRGRGGVHHLSAVYCRQGFVEVRKNN